MEYKKLITAAKGLPFSKGIVVNSKYLMEISGQVGLDEGTGKVEGNIKQQTILAMKNVKKILEEVGWDLNNLIKVRIYLTDMDNYVGMNEVYAKLFEKDFPTRVAIAVKELPLGALIELDCVAMGEDIK